MEPHASWSPREPKAARTYALAGVGLFLFSWVLGAIAATQGLAAIMPFADVALGLGFALAFFGIVLAGATLRAIIPLGSVAGIGLFYKAQDHATHVESGWGLGLDHLYHLFLGLILIGLTLGAAAFLSFHHTSADPPRGPETER